MDRIAGITSNTVPWEILRAAGYSPRLLDDEPGPTPYADRFMEDVFDRRIRVIFDRLCAGAWNLDLVVIPRTSEQEHKLYLYLREVSRLRTAPNVPKLHLYNLLHTRTPESYEYGLERTREMVRAFDASEEALPEAISESNRARSIVRKILELRREGRLDGSRALAMMRGFYTENRALFADRTQAALEPYKSVSPSSLPCLLIKGAPLDHTGLHCLIEQHGGYVAAEDDWRGSRAAGETDIQEDGDPVKAIFEKYFYDTVSPRIQPAHQADAWFHREIERSGVDGVVFYIPLTDDIAGWDYPRHLGFLESRGVPSLLIRSSGSPEPTVELVDQVSSFLGSLGPR